MKKIPILLVVLAALNCAAKPKKHPKMPKTVVEGVRAQCLAPPTPPPEATPNGCMWDKDSGRACCGSTMTVVAPDGGIWACMEYICQGACSSPWIAVQRECQLIGVEPPPPPSPKVPI